MPIVIPAGASSSSAAQRNRKTCVTRSEAESLFWSRISPNLVSGCWEWQRGVTDVGYGAMDTTFFTNRLAHRIAWELCEGPIPDDKFVLHHCDNRKCVNPGHLYLGSKADNARDREVRGRAGDHRGRLNGRAKLTVEQVHEIREAYRETPRGWRKQLGPQWGITYDMVYKVASHQNWAEVM